MTSIGYYLQHPNVALMGVIQKFGGFISSDELVIRVLYRLGGVKSSILSRP